MTQIIFPPGRIVKGHPMKRWPKKDDKTKQQKVMSNGELQFSTFIVYAIPKGAETDWKQTLWGKQIYDLGVTSWPTGEHAIAVFSWKVGDGDSKIPNKKMNIPCEQEGYPGHWLIFCDSLQPIACYHNDQLAPHQQIQDEKEVKTGDYGQLIAEASKNTANTSEGQTAGLFMTGKVFSLRQSGKRIVSKGEVNALEAFAGNMGDMPTNMILDDGIDAAPPPTPGAGTGAPPPPTPGAGTGAPPPPIEQAVDFAEPRVKIADGSIHTVKSLLVVGWPQETIDTLEKVI
jgi:hypothetical protein